MKIKYLLSLLIAGVLITLPSFSNAEIIETRTFAYPSQSKAYQDYLQETCPEKGWFGKSKTETDNNWNVIKISVECSSNELGEATITPCSAKEDKAECESHTSCRWTNNKCEDKCNWIKLNTDVPFIGDCIAFWNTNKGGSSTTKVNQVTAFPTLMGALMNIVMTATLIIWFLMIVVGGVLITTEGMNPWGQKKGKAMIVKVGAVLAILGLSGVILKLINPTFFT